jgi:hypothetical protein
MLSLVLCSIWFGARCITTCMYGAYMYGKNSEHVNDVYFDDEKYCN